MTGQNVAYHQCMFFFAVLRLSGIPVLVAYLFSTCLNEKYPMKKGTKTLHQDFIKH